MAKSSSPSRLVVYAAITAALYAVLVYAFAPISYGTIQLRVANVIKPLVLLNPAFSVGFGLGTFLANLGSPFGIWDFAVMPLVDIAAGLIAWRLRRVPLLALTIQSTLISLGVAIFPLGLGGGIPFIASFPYVMVSQLLIIPTAYMAIWKPLWSNRRIHEAMLTG